MNNLRRYLQEAQIQISHLEASDDRYKAYIDPIKSLKKTVLDIISLSHLRKGQA